MRLATLLTATALTAVASSLRFTNANFYNITPGVPFNITWADASGPVTLSLYKGATTALLEDIGTIADRLSGTNYVWTPNATLLRDIYNIHYTDSSGAEINSFQFELVLAPTTAAATATSTSAKASSTTQYTATWIWPTYV
ncbi:hypothetical protein BD289DRAFT_482254 [Coniella lustricola]|uniref:Ser-Thr-rich glycosyl-phosphatidyl-inositol-anchored membrane family-domain-containing protein n=1 Tax=Coniella lustricola TaxID=2025994 RepID=A0A2T3A9C9_9PEZI|nr:hypothetical protein BD289DRAFT_482254 [Coniella lustricola]